jgi:hypothetical protein
MTAAELRPPKRSARVALFALDGHAKSLLAECFRQCDIEVQDFPDSPEEIFRREKFEGGVVDLANESAEAMVQAARSSASHSRMVLFALWQAGIDLKRFSPYGINVLIQQPLVRQDALRAIRSARLLLLNELRRYVRIPLATPVRLQASFTAQDATTVEISAGGMSVQLAPGAKYADTDVRVTFTIPSLPPLALSGVVCWRKPDLNRIGVRFDPAAPEREAVKGWIEKYLGL